MILHGLKYRLLLIFFVTFGVFFSQKISLNYQFIYPDQAFKIPSYFSKKKSLSALSFLQNEKENAKILLAKKGYYSAKIADSLIDSTHLYSMSILEKSTVKFACDFPMKCWMPPQFLGINMKTLGT
ncbi:MAG: hypothetical protein EBQ66_11515 [Flavobacteriia bacterium]|nr:hypothetical protein [Flavobacteriia bacterium]